MHSHSHTRVSHLIEDCSQFGVAKHKIGLGDVSDKYVYIYIHICVCVCIVYGEVTCGYIIQ
jgi:hypothetical protein